MSVAPGSDLDKESKGGWDTNIRSRQFVIFILLFLFLSVLVALRVTDSFDVGAVTLFHDMGNENLDLLMLAFTLTGDLSVVLIAAIILAILRRTRRLGLAILVSIVVISILLVYVKPIIARPLPPFDFEPRVDLPEEFTLERDVLGFTHIPYSFPSGHETRAVSLSFLVGFFLSRKLKNFVHLVWVYPILVGISRLYISAHYPLDLFASVPLGIAISYVIIRVLKLDKASISDSKFSKK